jgi:hypothetical protein
VGACSGVLAFLALVVQPVLPVLSIITAFCLFCLLALFCPEQARFCTEVPGGIPLATPSFMVCAVFVCQRVRACVVHTKKERDLPRCKGAALGLLACALRQHHPHIPSHREYAFTQRVRRVFNRLNSLNAPDGPRALSSIICSFSLPRFSCTFAPPYLGQNLLQSHIRFWHDLLNLPHGIISLSSLFVFQQQQHTRASPRIKQRGLGGHVWI